MSILRVDLAGGPSWKIWSKANKVVPQLFQQLLWRRGNYYDTEIRTKFLPSVVSSVREPEWLVLSFSLLHIEFFVSRCHPETWRNSEARNLFYTSPGLVMVSRLDPGGAILLLSAITGQRNDSHSEHDSGNKTSTGCPAPTLTSSVLFLSFVKCPIECHGSRPSFEWTKILISSFKIFIFTQNKNIY